MAVDAIAIFSEGSVAEQASELVGYLARSKPDDDGPQFVAQFEIQPSLGEDEKQQRRVFTQILNETKDLGQGAEKEIEGFFNLLLAHLLRLFLSSPDGLAPLVQHLVDILSAAPPPDHLAVQLKLLSNIFNCLPRESSLRLTVYSSLLEVASANDLLDLLQLAHAPIGRWIEEWQITPEQKSQFLKRLADASLHLGAEAESYSYLLKHVAVLPKSSPDIEVAALSTIAAALRIPTVLDFNSLLELDAMSTTSSHPLGKLLNVFIGGSVQDYLSFKQSNASLLEGYGLVHSSLLTKIRSLTMASLCSSRIGQDISYLEISSALLVDDNQVEQCVIDAIHAGLISGKLSQPRRIFRISRSTARRFERQEWECLESRLLTLKSNLAGVLDLVASTRKTPQVADAATPLDPAQGGSQ